MNENNKKSSSPNMTRLISDLGPALAFFIAYFIANKTHQTNPLIFATIAFLPFAILGFAYSWLKEKKISPIGLFGFVMVVIFSALGIYLKNDIFIKMRPTAIYASMGLILLASVIFKRNILKTIFDGAFHLEDALWRGLSIRAGIMYLSLAVINEIMWRIFAPFTGAPKEVIWVTYNMWGDFGINMAFWIINMAILAKHFKDENGNPLLEDDKIE